MIAISISAMLGSGIFVLPGLAAAKTGSMVWLAYLVAGLGVLPAALSKSELATAMPTSGGTYVYLERTFGPFAGTVSGLGLWFSLLLKSAFALIGFGAYLGVLIDVPIQPVAIALLVVITTLNVLGVSVISRVQKLVVVVVLASLLILGFSGLWTVQATNLEQGFSHGVQGFIGAAAFVYISYAGVTKVAAIAEEVKNPNRNLPMGILISWLVVLCVYVFVVFVLVGNISTDQLLNSGTGEPNLHPIYTLATVVLGPTAGWIAAILAIITMVSMALAGLLAASRFPFAMSRDNLVPQPIRKIDSRLKTPINSILITAIVMAAAILFLPVEQLAKLASAFMILAFMFVCGTVIILRETASEWYKPQFRAPFYPWLQLFGMLVGVVLLLAIGWLSLIAFLGIAGIGAIAYVGYGRKHAARRGEITKMGTRRDLMTSEVETAQSLDDSLPTEASVVVPFFGRERSPETLVQMGAALAHGRKLEVLHITAVPEQVHIGDVLEDDQLSISLRRRIHTMADEENIALEYTETVSHDVVHTIYEVAVRVHCEWVVMESTARRDLGVSFQNPIGWLQDHLPCNLAVFKDAGIRYIREILVYAEPGPHDALVVATADHLAEIYNARLHFVCVVAEDSEPHELQARVDYVDQLRDLCQAPAKAIVIRNSDELTAIQKITSSFDLLVMGAPSDRGLYGRLAGSPKDVLTRRAECSVLWLKTPRTSTHGNFDLPGIRREQEFSLQDSIVSSCVLARAKIGKKEELFRSAAEMFAEHYQVISPDVIYAALMEREQMQNTSLGQVGLAVP
ncbi:MAG: amino acid permease, partial [Pirellulaceae bacterium]